MGDTTFKTFMGGLLSLLSRIFILGYTVYLIKIMTQKNDIETNISTNYWNPAKDIGQYKFSPG
jgi:hypothetical protein